jgi:predicted porin
MGTTGRNGTAAGINNTLSSRNSYLGLAGGFGTVLMGNHDTPFKMFGRSLDVFGDTTADTRQLLNAKNATYTDGTGWDLRLGNVLAYVTPNFNGFSGVLAYVSGAGQTATTAVGSDNNKLSAFSLNGTYKNGPIYAGLAYESNNFSDGKGLPNDPTAFRLGGSFTTGPIKVGAMYQALRDADGTDSERDDYTLFGTYSFGMETIKLAYTYAGEVDSGGVTTPNSDSSLFALGLDHKFSKRTKGYVQYTMLSNEKGVVTNTTLGGNSGYGNSVASAVDKSPSAFSVGLIHKF